MDACRRLRSPIFSSPRPENLGSPFPSDVTALIVRESCIGVISSALPLVRRPAMHLVQILLPLAECPGATLSPAPNTGACARK